MRSSGKVGRVEAVSIESYLGKDRSWPRTLASSGCGDVNIPGPRVKCFGGGGDLLKMEEVVAKNRVAIQGYLTSPHPCSMASKLLRLGCDSI